MVVTLVDLDFGNDSVKPLLINFKLVYFFKVWNPFFF